MKRTRFLYGIPLLLAASAAGAQSIGPSTINASGGSAAVAGNTHEWSIGEMAVINTSSSANLVVTQGVLQPNISTSGIGSDPAFASLLSVYPNPATDLLYLRHTLGKAEKLSVVLQDAAGKLLYTKETAAAATEQTEELNMAAYAAGTYLLSVKTGEGKSTSYKIQKLK